MMGAGIESGALFVPSLTSVSRAFFAVRPSLTPALLRLGDRGEHQLSVTLSRLRFTPGPGELNFSIASSYLFPSA
jgi:hypothetical protein